jgi:hypothetical protein
MSRCAAKPLDPANKYLYPTEYGQPPPPGHPAGLLLPPHDPNQPGGM